MEVLHPSGDTMTKTPCKTCDARGLMLETTEYRQVGNGILTEGTEIAMVPVACNCCGGWADDCENCREGRRVINWVSREDYDQVMLKWLEEEALPQIVSADSVDYMTAVVGTAEQVETMQSFLNRILRQYSDTEKVRKELQDLIPGDINDPVIIARRARLAMIQLLYDRGHLEKREAWYQLSIRLTPNDPDTLFDDSDLLQLKESDHDA